MAYALGMDIAAALLLRENAAPVAANSLGAQLLLAPEWNRLHTEASVRLSSGVRSAIFVVHRQGERPPWLVWLTPLMDCDSGRNGLGLCFVFDPERQVHVTGSLLQSIYRLTPAEIRLAEQLLQGRRPAEAAEALGVTIHTVRTYLKRLYHKIGARTQATLVRKLMQATSVTGLLAA